MVYYEGSWEYAGGNGMQVAMDVTWSAVSEGSTTAVATVKFYTDNQYSYSDAQVLNISNNLGSNHSFTNNSGTTEVYRTERTYTHTYTAGSYNSSPGNVTFSATIEGAYNGVTPTVSAAVAIPARPSHAPSAPTSVSATPNNGSITVSFAAPTDTGTGGIDLYQSSADNVNWSNIPDGVTSFTVSGTNGTATTGYVRALSNYGGYGPSASGTATPRTTASAPTSFAANGATFGQLGLSWATPSSNGGAAVSGYTLIRTSPGTATTLLTNANQTTYTDSSLLPYTDYTYTVAAVNAAGTGTTATVTQKTLGGIAKIWNGTTWVVTLPKVWNGTTWTDAQARMWNSTEWKHGI